MFDFAPVGLVCAVVGVLFVALVGWRLIPAARRKQDAAKELFELENYIAELKVAKDAGIIGQKISELGELVEGQEVQIVGLVRRKQRLPAPVGRYALAAGDVLVVEAGPEAIENLSGSADFENVDGKKGADILKGSDVEMWEVVVPQGAWIVGRSAQALHLLGRHGVSLLGVSREGRRFRERLRKLGVRAGDILLLLGPGDGLTEAVQRTGCLPLAERGLQIVQRDKAGLAVGIFAVAIALASFGVVYLPVALGSVVVLYVLFGIVPLRELYDSIEWPVIILLGSLIPLGQALETSGGTGLIAENLISLSAGFSAVVVLVLLMVITMTLSDVMNNTATAVIAAPIAIQVASGLGVSADPFLMAVAVAASSAFLTPIGHKNNTLIMGPGGYKFGDYWRMGLPLEILVVAVSVPMILLVWPL